MTHEVQAAEHDFVMYLLSLAFAFVLSLPVWMPVVFLAYAVGRKKYGVRFLFILATAKAVALSISTLVWQVAWSHAGE